MNIVDTVNAKREIMLSHWLHPETLKMEEFNEGKLISAKTIMTDTTYTHVTRVATNYGEFGLDVIVAYNENAEGKNVDIYLGNWNSGIIPQEPVFESEQEVIAHFDQETV